MNILNALKSKVQYPLSDDTFNSILIDRELSGVDEYSKEIANSTLFKGALADSYMQVIICANVSEGGVSITLTESKEKQLLSMANVLYSAIGEKQQGNIPIVTIEPF